LYPTFGKVGVQNFFPLAPLANPVLYPHFKIRGGALTRPAFWLLQSPTYTCNDPRLILSWTPGLPPTKSGPGHKYYTVTFKARLRVTQGH